MKNSDIQDIIFRSAVEAIDKGDIPALQQLVAAHPRLLNEKLTTTNEGHFKDPYLLYFIADNPIRVDLLPINIVAVTAWLIDALRAAGVPGLQQQLDYTLMLVSSGRIPRECGVQIALIDLLINEGAAVGNALGALANGNIEAARHLVDRGSELTLAVATGLDSIGDIKRLAPTAGNNEKSTALAVAAFYGKADLVSLLLSLGADPNRYPDGDGFHHHGTPLHQAVASGSLTCVKLLAEVGADLTIKDKIYSGTPLDWALYLQTEESKTTQTTVDGTTATVNNYAPIVDYLRGRQ
jgi:hypothetical protein